MRNIKKYRIKKSLTIKEISKNIKGSDKEKGFARIGASGAFKRDMRRVFWFFFAMFVVLGVYFTRLVLIEGSTFITNPYNKRISMADNGIKRGSILDAKGNVLAQSIAVENGGQGGYFREYPYGKVLCHLIGYSAMGRSGIESKFNFELQTVNLEIVQRLKNLAIGTEIEANNVVTTVDAGLSNHIRKQLGEQKGVVVVMEPSTGKVLSMISYPNFNPETVLEDWTQLNRDEESPLLNRATQGLYIPGSTYKILVAAAAIEYMAGWENFTYECTGSEVFEDNKIRCYDSKAHGLVDLKKAFAESCNTYFSQLGTRISPEIMRKVATDFYINQAYWFELDYSQGSFTLEDDASISQIIQTSIGQGKTLATPLNMAMVASAVANGGLMMKPYIVDKIETPSGGTVSKNLPQALSQVIPYETAEIVKEMMIECVVAGTGAPASLSALNISVAGKTGTAENPAGEDHSWFVGFAPADKPEIAFAIVLENSGGGGKSLKLAKSFMEYYFENK